VSRNLSPAPDNNLKQHFHRPKPRIPRATAFAICALADRTPPTATAQSSEGARVPRSRARAAVRRRRRHAWSSSNSRATGRPARAPARPREQQRRALADRRFDGEHPRPRTTAPPRREPSRRRARAEGPVCSKRTTTGDSSAWPSESTGQRSITLARSWTTTRAAVFRGRWSARRGSAWMSWRPSQWRAPHSIPSLLPLNGLDAGSLPGGRQVSVERER
jgi:hypothetical protein